MLTAEERTQLREQGYLCYEALIHGEKLAHYVAVFDELVERAQTQEQDAHWTFEKGAGGAIRPERILHKIQGVCYVEPRVLELAREPEITQRVAAILGDNLDIFGTKFFPLLPNGGTSTFWHQDNYYFDTETERLITCGIYLQDADIENGCLKVIPGSHKRGRFEHRPDPTTYGGWVDVDESEAVHLEVPAGTVLLFSGNLLHSANPNVSDRTRYSTAWHYIPGDMSLPPFERDRYPDRHVVLGS